MWNVPNVCGCEHSSRQSHKRIDNGTVDVRNLCTRTVLAEVELSEPHFIMWTSSHVDTVDDYWLGTHFVPLIPLGESVMVIAEGDDCEDEFNSAFLRSQLCQP